MKKQIILTINIDSEQDEFNNVIKLEGFEKGKPFQNIIELVGFLEVVQQQELKKIFKKEVKK